jgi:hypothetical protein
MHGIKGAVFHKYLSKQQYICSDKNMEIYTTSGKRSFLEPMSVSNELPKTDLKAVFIDNFNDKRIMHAKYSLFMISISSSLNFPQNHIRLI